MPLLYRFRFRAIYQDDDGNPTVFQTPDSENLCDLTTEQERLRIFNGDRSRSSASLKRKVTSDDDEFKRVSNRRASAPRSKNIVAKQIAMR